VAFLPHDGTAFNCISRMSSRHNIRMVNLPPRKVLTFFQPIKDDLALKIQGIYNISVGL
jgi:hypothetical protein